MPIKVKSLEIDYGLSKENGKRSTQNFEKLFFARGIGAVFEGACVNSGAQLTCIGAKKANLYCTAMNKTFKTIGSDLLFKFVNLRH